MPDVLTHLLVGASIAIVYRRNGPRIEQMLIILGAVLIDIERPFSWLLAGTSLEWISLGQAFHSILGAVVLAYFAAACFQINGLDFNSVFKLILIGCISHLLLDMVMYPWAEYGLYLLYPLQLALSFNLLWPDLWWYPILGVTLLLLSLLMSHLLKMYHGS